MISKRRTLEIIVTLLADYIALICSWFIFYSSYSVESEIFTLVWGIAPFTSGFILGGYWLFILAVFGMYKRVYLISRLDEFIRVVKVTGLGTLILFFIITTSQRSVLVDATRSTFYYWLVVTGAIALSRFIIRSGQRKLAELGKGLHKAVIVGVGESALDAYKDLLRNKTLGMEVYGYIQPENQQENEEVAVPEDMIVGHINNLEQFVKQNNIEDVIVCLKPENRHDLMKVLSEVNMPNVTVKILPDFYHLVNGLNKTNQIFGLPLIEISPDAMPIWEKITKRSMDIVISVLCLAVTIPLNIIIATWIKLDSEGPVIYKQTRVGLYGKNFTMYKFRTMQKNAEKISGPVWADEDDPRITRSGYWLRKLRLDEIPQCINVLKGEMSLVGPRPERPHFVKKFKDHIPLYTRRLRVQPGITGWAQVKWKYDSSVEDVKEKTKYDLFYVENMSLRMDLKILINTVMTVIRAKGQ